MREAADQVSNQEASWSCTETVPLRALNVVALRSIIGVGVFKMIVNFDLDDFSSGITSRVEKFPCCFSWGCLSLWLFSCHLFLQKKNRHASMSRKWKSSCAMQFAEPSIPLSERWGPIQSLFRVGRAEPCYPSCSCKHDYRAGHLNWCHRLMQNIVCEY